MKVKVSNNLLLVPFFIRIKSIRIMVLFHPFKSTIITQAIHPTTNDYSLIISFNTTLT
jgi:hypothetical protein